MKLLDLSFDANLSDDHSRIFSYLARIKIKKFNKIIGKLYSKIEEKNFLLWVISNTSSRNPYSSKIFYYYLSFYFLKETLKKNNINKIIVDSIIQKKILNKVIKNKKIEIKLKKKNSNSYLRFIKFFCRFLIIKISKIFEVNKINSKKISLLMTSIIDGYVLKSRYFPKLFEKIDKKKNIFFVPNIMIFKFSSFIKNLIILRRTKIYLIKEDFISFKDFFSVLNIYKKIKTLFKKKNLDKNFQLADLIKEELLDQKYTFSNLESFMNYVFIKNLKKQAIHIKTSVVWFENQPFERSWSYALNKYHENSKSVGYMGIVPANMYISQDHTLPEDRRYKLIPKNILTIGNYFKNNIKKYDSKLKTTTVSALSFQHLFNKKKTNKINQILVALPILKKDSDQILEICKNLMNIKFLSKFKLIIRPHPTTNIQEIKKIIINLDIKNSQIDVNKSFYDSLKKSKFFIGGMSSTCLESVILNIPTIIFKSNDYLRSSCIPNIINRKHYLYSKDYNEIIKFMKKNKKNSLILSNKIRNSCFKIRSNNLLNEFNL